MINFVIFTTPRTGSTLLIKTLDRHPEIMCAGEIFLLKRDMFHNDIQYPFWRVPYIGNKLNSIINIPIIWLSLNRFIKTFFNANCKSEKARGFKLMYYQVRYTPGIINYLRKNNVKVIVLIRKDILRNSLSVLRARSTGVYHHNGHDHSNEFPKLKVDFEELKERIRNTQEVNMRLENLSVYFNSKIIYYEDFKNWDQTISSLLNYIGVTDMPLQAATQKLNPDKLKDMIENYAALKKWLSINWYGDVADI